MLAPGLWFQSPPLAALSSTSRKATASRYRLQHLILETLICLPSSLLLSLSLSLSFMVDR